MRAVQILAPLGQPSRVQVEAIFQREDRLQTAAEIFDAFQSPFEVFERMLATASITSAFVH
jgi:hypothetical protein